MKDHPKSNFDFLKPSKHDFVLIAVILGFSFFSVSRMILKARKESSDEKRTLIYQNGKLMRQIGLSEDKEVWFLGEKLQVQIKAGRIRVLKADCPEHVCMNTGWIQHSGQTIVCVPNKVLIEIKSIEPVLVDAVTY